ALDFRAQQKLVAAPSQTSPQLDVLNLRTGEMPFVETAYVDEIAPSDGTATGPERLSRASALLMDIVVKKIPEGRNRAVTRRIGGVGTERSRELRVLREEMREPPQRVGMYTNVAVDEDDDFAARRLDATVAGVGGPMRLPCQAHDDVRKLSRN